MTGDTRISQLPGATTLTGSELIPMVQSGQTVKITAAQLVAYIAVLIGPAGLTAPLDVGPVAYSDTGVLSQFTGNSNSYQQSIIQNTNGGNTASADLILSNNLGTATTHFLDVGINSSTFAGAGSFNLPNASFVSATTGDLVIGTATANAVHFVVNGGATDAGSFNGTTGLLTLNNGLTVAGGATSWSGLAAGSISGNAATATLAANATLAAGLSATLAVASGGTGATTATAALTSLGIITSATGSIIAPSGTTVQRDSSPAFGYIRGNSQLTQMEWWNGTVWGPLGGGATGGGADQVFQVNSMTVTTNYSIPSGKSASAVGPLTINSGVSITVPTGSRLVIL